MKREDLNVLALIGEAIDIIFIIAYMGLQIFYGIYYSRAAYVYIINIVVLLLVYAGLTLLSNYPERLNRIPAAMCTGRIRKYSLRMIRIVKLIFIAGLLVPCVCDALGFEIQSAYSLIVIGLVIIIAVYYEYKILKEIKKSAN